MRQTKVIDLVSAGLLRVEDGNHGNDRPRPQEFSTEGVSFIRAADMTNGVVNFSTAGRINAVARARIRKGVGAPGDVIMSHKGTVGKVAVAPDDSPEFICSPQTTFWRSLDESEISQAYLRYVLVSDDFKRQLEFLKGQTDMAPYVSLSDQRSMTLVLPAIRQQQAIAEVLGALDDKIAANTKLAFTAEELAGNVFDRATSSFSKRPMSDVLTPILGGTPARANPDFWDGTDLWASAKDVTGAPFAVVIDTEEKITPEAIRRTKAKPLPAGSVILTARGTVGAVARLAVPLSFNQSCYGFTPDEVAPGLLYFSILRAAQLAKSLAHGSVFDTITMRTFDHLPIADFGDSSNHIEAQIAPLLELVTANVQENNVLAATRDALLPQLMSGDLSVKDAEELVAAEV